MISGCVAIIAMVVTTLMFVSARERRKFADVVDYCR